MNPFQPTVAYAAASPKGFSEFVNTVISNSEQAVLPLIVGAAFVTFLWGVAQYLRSAGDEKRRKDGILYISSGLIGLTVIFGVWGFVSLLSTLLGSSVAVPQLGS